MNYAFLFSLFCFLASPAFSQFYSYSDSSLWGSPLSAEKAVQQNIQKVIIRRTGPRTVPCPECKTGYRRFKKWTATTIYEFDRYGYPLRVFFTGEGKDTVYLYKNEYESARLVRSESGNRVYTAHYNSQNLRDTCTWFENDKPVYRSTYIFDPLYQLIQWDCYNPRGGELQLYFRNRIRYDEKRRLLGYHITSPPQNTWEKERITTYETVYDKGDKNSVTYGRSHEGDTFSITKNTYKGDQKWSVTHKSCYGRRCKPYRQEEISKKGRSIYYRHYFLMFSVFSLTDRTSLHVSSGLLLKEERFSRRFSRHRKWRHWWRTLFSKRAAVTEYIYEKHTGERVQG